jgi:hypothetical protein
MPKLDSRASLAPCNLVNQSNGPCGLFDQALVTVGKENAGQRYVGVRRTRRLPGRPARGRRARPPDHRSRPFPGSADPDHLAPPAAVGCRGAPDADRLCRGAHRHRPGLAADWRRIFADLGRDRHAHGRDHHPRPGSAHACPNRRTLPLGQHPAAGRGARPVWPGAEGSRVRRSSPRRAMATSACGSQGATPPPSSGHPCCRNSVGNARRW